MRCNSHWGGLWTFRAFTSCYVVMDSPLCTQRASELWPNFLSTPELKTNSPKGQKNVLEEPENDLRKLESTTEEDKSKGWPGKVSVPRGKVAQVIREIEQYDANKMNRFDENENITDERKNIPDCYGRKFGDGRTETPVRGHPFSYSEKFKHLTFNLEEHPSLASTNGPIKSTGSVHGQIKPESDADKVAASRSYSWGYFAGKLSEAYKDAGKRLQSTLGNIQNAHIGEIKVVLSQYMTATSRETPPTELKPEPEPCKKTKTKVDLFDLTRDRALSPPRIFGASSIPNVAEWPKGSVSFLRNTSPEVFYQRLIEPPPALSLLQASSSQKIQEKLESLVPQVQVGELRSIFWLKAANRKQPIPKPGCLLLSEKKLIVVSADSEDNLDVFHTFDLMELTKVQIGLAGQHVRLVGCSEDTILAVFTHSKELTQDFCKALLRVVSPAALSDGTEAHPLLSDDLMALSLDWTSTVPDITLDSGLCVTSRFKRVLADLLYIIHGNMDGPAKPFLADVRPLLYTSVKVINYRCARQDTIFQFLLTDTHIALLQEDGIFHPVPRGSSLVPVQPQFQGLELRRRSDIRCLLVRQNESCLVVDIVFTTGKVESRRGSDRVLSASDYSSQGDLWKLSFGCTAEALILVNNLCT